jgi:hypothetical protein
LGERFSPDLEWCAYFSERQSPRLIVFHASARLFGSFITGKKASESYKSTGAGGGR